MGTETARSVTCQSCSASRRAAKGDAAAEDANARRVIAEVMVNCILEVFDNLIANTVVDRELLG